MFNQTLFCFLQVVAMFIHSPLIVSIASLSAPILKTYTTASTLIVDVMLPSGPNGVSIEDIIIRSKPRPSKVAIYYDIEITEPAWATQKVRVEVYWGALYLQVYLNCTLWPSWH